MFYQKFQGNEYSYSYENETDQFLLFKNNYSDHVVLKDYDVYLFRARIGWINSQLSDQTEEEKNLHMENEIAYFLRNRY